MISGRKIHGLDDLAKRDDYDCVLIGVGAYDKKPIVEKLRKYTDKEIIENISDILPTGFIWDISETCNAKCRYCVTGYHNRFHDASVWKEHFISLEKFKEIYRHGYDVGIFSKGNFIELYNWAEPFLNPQYLDIISFLSESEQKYGISTNASVLKKADNGYAYKYCQRIIFSMPGFSQKSYDHIHGFNFETVKRNIEEIINNMRQNGFNGLAEVAYHLYTFSECELEECKKWAESLGIEVWPYRPSLIGNSLVEDYYKGSMPKDYAAQMEKDEHLSEMIAAKGEKPADYWTHLCDEFVLDIKGNILMCCLGDDYCKDFNTKVNIMDINSYDDYLAVKRKGLDSEMCCYCRNHAIDYYFS